GARRRRQLRAGDVGEADPGLFEHGAVAQHARAPAAAFLALPAVLDETRLAVRALDRGADAVLQPGQVVADQVESRHMSSRVGAAEAAMLFAASAAPTGIPIVSRARRTARGCADTRRTRRRRA